MADEPAQPVSVPERIPRPAAHKIVVGSVAGSATIVLVWLAHSYGIDIPAEVAQAITMLAGTGISLLVPDDMEA